jgi:hypothetical protein
MVALESERGLLRYELDVVERGLLGQQVPERGSVVVGSEDEVEPESLPIEGDGQLRAVVPAFPRFARDERIPLVPARAAGIDDAKPSVQSSDVTEGETQGGRRRSPFRES